jgi:Ca-activated chloride channel homolog
VLDEKNKLIPNVSIFVHSSKMFINGGSSGTFGLNSNKSISDTFTFVTDGYEKVKVEVFVSKYNTVKLKLLLSVANLQKNKLASLTKDFKSEKLQSFFATNETYSNLIENEFVQAKKFPLTGFAVNSDKASYSNIRRFINMQSKVPTNAVRIDEVINYFNLPDVYYKPTSKTFQINSQLTDCPWEKGNLLLYVNIGAKKLDLSTLPPSNLVFLVDNSGSMELQNRMPLLKSAFKLLVNNLRDKDTISIVTYGGHVDVAMAPISGKYKDSILKAIEAMEAAGDTPGESAIRIAYNIAKNKFLKNGNNRVILATDGDFNVGISDEAELEKLITIQSQSGIYLTCLGIGMGNYKDSKLEVLAKKGNGNFAYIDSETEAEKVLVKEMTQTLFSVADKTFMNVKFSSDYIDEYRLIGFDNKLNALTDTSSKLEGGEVGSGYNSIVLFEIKPTINFNATKNKDYASVIIKYEDPKTHLNNECSYECVGNYVPFDTLHKVYKFATSLAMFGGYIKQSSYMRNVVLDDIIAIASGSLNAQNKLQVEFGELLLKAKKIYEPGKKKKKKISKT